MSWLARLFWVVLALFVFFFTLLAVNQEKIALQFVTWRTPEWSVFWWLLAAFGLGAALATCGFAVSSTRQNLRNRRLSRRLAQVESELRKPRNTSFED